MDLEIVGVPNRAPVPAEGPDDHPVLIQDAGVLALALVSIAKRAVGWLDERGIRADRQQAQAARRQRSRHMIVRQG